MVMSQKFPKGLRLDNKRLVPIDGALDLDNVLLNRNGDLENRFGWNIVNSGQVTSYGLEFLFSNVTTFDYLQLSPQGIYEAKATPTYSTKQEKISYNNLGLSRLTGGAWQLIDAIAGSTFPQFISTPIATYIPNGETLVKYDGQHAYAAGGYKLSDTQGLYSGTPEDLSFNAYSRSSAFKKLAGNTAGAHRYAMRLKFTDANLNSIYSDFLRTSYDYTSGDWKKYIEVTSGANEETVITFQYNQDFLATLQLNIDYFLTNYVKVPFGYAIVSSDLVNASIVSPIVIPVLAGHTLKVGDMVPFSCSGLIISSGSFSVIYLKVTAVGATSVTFANPTITIPGPISSQLKVNFYRNQYLSNGWAVEIFKTKAGAADAYYKIGELPFPLSSPVGPGGAIDSGTTSILDGGTKAATFVNTSTNIGIAAHGLVVNNVVYFKENLLSAGFNFTTNKCYVKTVVDVNNIEVSSTPGGAAIAAAFTGGAFAFWGAGDAVTAIVPAIYDSIPDSALSVSNGWFLGQIYDPSIQDQSNTNLDGIPYSTFGFYHQDSLFLGGDPENRNLLSISNPGEYEIFNGLSNISVGTLDDGKLIGGISINDVAIVYCERQVFIISGEIYNGNYRIDRCGLNKIGCQSFATIKEIDGYVLSLHTEGVYATRAGGQPEEISSAIRPLFLSMIATYNFSLARSAVDDINNRYYLYIPHNTSGYMLLVYDFYFQEWFKFSNFDCSGGLAGFEDEIIFQNAAVYKEIDYTDRLDNVTPISWYYVAQDENFNAPELKKKNLWLTTFSIPSFFNETNYDPSFTFTLKEYYNWAQNPTTTSDISFPSSQESNYRAENKLNSNNLYSHRVRFQGNANEKVRISGWTYWTEETQMKVTK